MQATSHRRFKFVTGEEYEPSQPVAVSDVLIGDRIRELESSSRAHAVADQHQVANADCVRKIFDELPSIIYQGSAPAILVGRVQQRLCRGPIVDENGAVRTGGQRSGNAYCLGEVHIEPVSKYDQLRMRCLSLVCNCS